MTAVDHADLKRLAEGATQGPRDAGLCEDALTVRHEWAVSHKQFREHATPAVVLALLSEIEGLKAERDAYREAAHLEAVCGDDAERQLSALRTEAPDNWRPDREAVARIVDFRAWDFYDRHISNPVMLAECKHEVGPSLAKADAILALRPQTAESGT